MYVRLVEAPLLRVFDTCEERTTRVPYSSVGGASAALRVGWNRNDPLPSAALTASARRLISAAYMGLRISQAVGAATASGSLPSMSATSWASNVFPFAPTVDAVCDVIPEYVNRPLICVPPV